jgi:hypothetical protein
MVVTSEQREAAVESLVRTRIDREGGAGTYENAVAQIESGGAAAAGLKAAIDRARERAERNVADVLAALASVGVSLTTEAPLPLAAVGLE